MNKYYYLNDVKLYTIKTLKNKIVNSLKKLNILKDVDSIEIDVSFKKHNNEIFINIDSFIYFKQFDAFFEQEKIIICRVLELENYKEMIDIFISDEFINYQIFNVIQANPFQFFTEEEFFKGFDSKIFNVDKISKIVSKKNLLEDKEKTEFIFDLLKNGFEHNINYNKFENHINTFLTLMGYMRFNLETEFKDLFNESVDFLFDIIENIDDDFEELFYLNFKI